MPISERRRLALLCAGLACLCVLAYLPGLTSPFTQYDDSLYVTFRAPQLEVPGWAGLTRQWDSTRSWNGEFVEFFPLRDTAYWAIYQGFGLDPLPYHAANLAFHVAATLLLLFFLRRVGLDAKAAGFAALLFAVHPVHTESVVWIAGLKDPMYLAFMLGGLLAYARYREKPGVGWYVLMLAGLICALLVKSMAIVMPLLMLGLELFVGPRASWKTIAARLAGPALITAEFLAMFLAIGKANRIMAPLHGGSLLSHVVLTVWAQARYLKQALLPTSFRLIYCFEPPSGWGDWRLWVGLAVLLAVAGLAWTWRKERLRLFFMGWYAAALLPVANLVPFPAVMADRYLYAASVGSCALLGLLASRLNPRLFTLVTVAAALLLTSTTAARSWVWQDEEQLWAEADEDPACMADRSFPAAQAHFLRFQAAHDRAEGFLALERALASPGFNAIGEWQICTALSSAASEAWARDDAAAAALWAERTTRVCPNDARGWNVTMVINLHQHAQRAAAAALKAWRLTKDPQAEVLVWLTQLEIGEEKAPAELARLARKRDPSTCQKIVQWSLDSPTFAPRFAEAVESCVSAGLTNRP